MPTGAGSSNQLNSAKERVLGDTLVATERGHPETEGDSLLFRRTLRELVDELSEDERLVLSLRWAGDGWMLRCSVEFSGA